MINYFSLNIFEKNLSLENESEKVLNRISTARSSKKLHLPLTIGMVITNGIFSTSICMSVLTGTDALYGLMPPMKITPATNLEARYGF